MSTYNGRHASPAQRLCYARRLGVTTATISIVALGSAALAQGGPTVESVNRDGEAVETRLDEDGTLLGDSAGDWAGEREIPQGELTRTEVGAGALLGGSGVAVVDERGKVAQVAAKASIGAPRASVTVEQDAAPIQDDLLAEAEIEGELLEGKVGVNAAYGTRTSTAGAAASYKSHKVGVETDFMTGVTTTTNTLGTANASGRVSGQNVAGSLSPEKQSLAVDQPETEPSTAGAKKPGAQLSGQALLYDGYGPFVLDDGTVIDHTHHVNEVINAFGPDAAQPAPEKLADVAEVFANNPDEAARHPGAVKALSEALARQQLRDRFPLGDPRLASPPPALNTPAPVVDTPSLSYGQNQRSSEQAPKTSAIGTEEEKTHQSGLTYGDAAPDLDITTPDVDLSYGDAAPTETASISAIGAEEEHHHQSGLSYGDAKPDADVPTPSVDLAYDDSSNSDSRDESGHDSDRGAGLGFGGSDVGGDSSDRGSDDSDDTGSDFGGNSTGSIGTDSPDDGGPDTTSGNSNHADYSGNTDGYGSADNGYSGSNSHTDSSDSGLGSSDFGGNNTGSIGTDSSDYGGSDTSSDNDNDPGNDW